VSVVQRAGMVEVTVAKRLALYDVTGRAAALIEDPAGQ
jgi:hypothetical protein